MCKWPTVETANPMITIPLPFGNAHDPFFIVGFEMWNSREAYLSASSLNAVLSINCCISIRRRVDRLNCNAQQVVST